MEKSWLYLHEKEQINAFNLLSICKNYQFLKNQEISILSIFRSKNVILYEYSSNLKSINMKSVEVLSIFLQMKIKISGR